MLHNIFIFFVVADLQEIEVGRAKYRKKKYIKRVNLKRFTQARPGTPFQLHWDLLLPMLSAFGFGDIVNRFHFSRIRLWLNSRVRKLCKSKYMSIFTTCSWVCLHWNIVKSDLFFSFFFNLQKLFFLKMFCTFLNMYVSSKVNYACIKHLKASKNKLKRDENYEIFYYKKKNYENNHTICIKIQLYDDRMTMKTTTTTSLLLWIWS
jgi:hypothetical protein